MSVQSSTVTARNVLITFPKEYSLNEALDAFKSWEWKGEIVMKWDIVDGHPTILATRKDNLISQRIARHTKMGIIFETGNFTIPKLTDPSPISQGGGSQVKDCEPERRQVSDCKEKLALEKDMERNLRKTIDDKDKQIEKLREELTKVKAKNKELEDKIKELENIHEEPEVKEPSIQEIKRKVKANLNNLSFKPGWEPAIDIGKKGFQAKMLSKGLTLTVDGIYEDRENKLNKYPFIFSKGTKEDMDKINSQPDNLRALMTFYELRQ